MRKVVVCADLTPFSIDTLKYGLPFVDQINGSEVHLVHCYENQIYAGDLYSSESIDTKQEEQMEEVTIKQLENLEKYLNTKMDPTSIIKKCLVSSRSKESVCEYVHEVNADIVVVASRGVKGIAGIFTSSFAEFMLKHASCPLYVVRPDKS